VKETYDILELTLLFHSKKIRDEAMAVITQQSNAKSVSAKAYLLQYMGIGWFLLSAR
jgi:hypothetical protein